MVFNPCKDGQWSGIYIKILISKNYGGYSDCIEGF